LGNDLLPTWVPWRFYTCAVIAYTVLFAFCTNQFHKWAHTKEPAAWIRALQRAGLILSPEHHAVHHASPQDKYYCITVGWMNPLLERIRFFRACEAAIGWIYPNALRTRRMG
jgi:ubiquitin-conjugating enzyme E2 variant